MYATLSGLLNGVILATALTAGVGMTLRMISRSALNAATRYVIWLVTLAAVIVIPLMFVPSRRPLRPVARTTLVAPSTAAPSNARVPIVVVRPQRPAAIPIQVPARAPVPKGLIYVWPALTIILLARLAVATIRLNRLKARSHPFHLPRAEQWLAFCKGRRRDIRFALSTEIATPIATGPLRPTILIPAQLFENLNEEDLDRVGLHETAHLVRRDDYALILQRIIEALLISYPLIFWIARRIDLEREIACDDLVIAATGRPRSYAACLARIVESCDGKRSPWPAATAAEDGSQLARRVDALLDKTRRAGAHLMKTRLAAGTAILACLILLTGKAPTLVAFVTTTVAAHAPLMLPVRPAPILPLPVQAQSSAPEDLAGQVVEDASGHPVLSAELRFRKAGMRELAADLETDPQGRFSAPGLPGGQYTVQVVKPNYESVTFQLSVPSPRLTVRLNRFGAIDGRATNMAGQPVPGVVRIPTGRAIGGGHITILTKDEGSARLNTFRDVQLEEDGHYRVFDLPPGRYAVGFWYSGINEGAGMQLYPDTASPKFFTIAGGEEYDHIDFIVMPRPSATIAGKLQLPEGMKKSFQIALGLPDQPSQPFAQLWSEEDGSFRFEKIPPGIYDLFAAGPVSGYGGGGALSQGDPPLFGRSRVQSSPECRKSQHPARAREVRTRGRSRAGFRIVAERLS
jgi:beta-lactamase regulating signal transducer with metallopeptidase domain